MACMNRQLISGKDGSFHLISRVVGGEFLLEDEEKEFFLYLLEQLAQVYYVRIYAYCILGNHFHILASVNEQEAENASKEELFARYQKLKGKGMLPPEGSYNGNGELIPDGDEGVERLKRRLGSISRFMQELKQGFGKWYNKRNHRTGYFWSGRFKGVIIFRGEGELACQAYIELNPVRAHIVECPEDYRWSSIGLLKHQPQRAKSFLTPLPLRQARTNENETTGECSILANPNSSERQFSFLKDQRSEVDWYYKEFAYASGLNVRIRNFSQGIAIGNEKEIENYQKSLGRKHIAARKFLSASWAFSTRVLRLRE